MAEHSPQAAPRPSAILRRNGQVLVTAAAHAPTVDPAVLGASRDRDDAVEPV